jgi:hypothetical protein
MRPVFVNRVIIIEAVTRGEIPNSMSVPLFDARIALNYIKGSADYEVFTPYKGTLLQIS